MSPTHRWRASMVLVLHQSRQRKIILSMYCLFFFLYRVFDWSMKMHAFFYQKRRIMLIIEKMYADFPAWGQLSCWRNIESFVDHQWEWRCRQRPHKPINPFFFFFWSLIRKWSCLPAQPLPVFCFSFILSVKLISFLQLFMLNGLIISSHGLCRKYFVFN